MTADLALFAEPEPDFSRFGDMLVREVGAETTRRWVEEWHYAGRYPHAARFVGGFAPDLAGIVSLSIPTNPHGVAPRLGLSDIPGNMEISRVVSHPKAPKNTPSKLIGLACHLWRARGFEWVFSYADTGQGHHGGIYQALNAVYVGITPGRPGYLLDGVDVHPRALVAVYGTQKWPDVRDIVAKRGHTLERIDGANTAKHLYVLPIGTPASRRAIRNRLAAISLPYPKRGAA